MCKRTKGFLTAGDTALERQWSVPYCLTNLQIFLCFTTERDMRQILCSQVGSRFESK